MNTNWQGVFPAATTKFNPDFTVDFEANRRFFRFLIDSGVHGLILAGSLGEASTLIQDEKLDLLSVALEEAKGKVPVLLCVAEASTASAIRFAQQAAARGADGLMVLPPMQYLATADELIAYIRTIADSVALPLMIYNNPVSYCSDITPEMFLALADQPEIIAIKESSDDVRRIAAIRNLCADRYRVFCGVDNLALESLFMGADGWVAGLVCAFPRETVAIYNLFKGGRLDEARALYRWFLPLLQLDVSPQLVQNIKLAEAICGTGNEIVRPPRLALKEMERERVVQIIKRALETRPYI